MVIAALFFGNILTHNGMWEGDVFKVCRWTSVASLVLYGGLLIYHADSVEVETKTELVSTTPIYSMRPFSDITGSFFLGGGYVNTRYNYVSYVRQPDGGLRAIKLGNHSTLYEDATSPEDAYYEVFQIYNRDSAAHMSEFWRYVLGYETYSEWSEVPGGVLIKIHVPAGTVVQVFEG
jgi:hypothetical protein